MRGNDHDLAGGRELAEELHEPTHAFGVEVRVGLVEQIHVAVAEERTCDRDALSLPCGERVRRDRDRPFRERRETLPQLWARGAAKIALERGLVDVVGRKKHRRANVAARQQIWALRNVTNALPPLGDVGVVRGAKDDLAAVRQLEPKRDVEQRRFAGSVAPGEHEDFARQSLEHHR